MVRLNGVEKEWVYSPETTCAFIFLLCFALLFDCSLCGTGSALAPYNTSDLIPAQTQALRQLSQDLLLPELHLSVRLLHVVLAYLLICSVVLLLS